MTSVVYAILIHIILTCLSSISVVRGTIYDREHKRRQLLFAFLVPFVGPVFTLMVYWGDRSRLERPSGRYMGQSIDESPMPWFDIF